MSSTYFLTVIKVCSIIIYIIFILIIAMQINIFIHFQQAQRSKKSLTWGASRNPFYVTDTRKPRPENRSVLWST